MVRAVLALLCFFSIGYHVTSAAQAADAPYVIYAIMSLSGPAAFVGKAETDSLRAAERLVNERGGIRGRRIHFDVLDDQSNPATTVQLLNQVLAKHVNVFAGPDYAGGCGAVAPLILSGPTSFCFSPAFFPASGSYMFAAGVSSQNLAIASLRFMRNHHWRRIALITATDATGKDGERHTIEAMRLRENSGLELVANEHFNGTDISVGAQLAHIKAAGAQAIMVWAVGAQFATVLHGVADGAINIPIVTSGANTIPSQISQYDSFIPDQTYFQAFLTAAPTIVKPGPIRTAQDEYFKALRAVNAEPSVATGTDWDPIMVMFAALQAVGLDAPPQAIRDYVLRLHGFAGTNGLLDFRDGSQRGTSIESALIVKWDKRTNTFVPASGRGGELLPNEHPAPN